MASVLALTVNFGISNEAHAINYSTINLDNKFIVEISRGNPDSYTSNENNDYVGYLVYSPTDVNFTGLSFWKWEKLERWGKLYLYFTITLI